MDKQTINTAVDDAANLAQLFLPQFGAYILIGKSVAKAAPEIYEQPVKLLGNGAPTRQETAELLLKVQALAHPDVPMP